MKEAGAGIGRLGPVDPVELGRMADRLVHLQRHLLRVDHDRRHRGRAERRPQQLGRLLDYSRGFAREAEREHVLPARSGARPAVGARIAADLRDVAVGRVGVDSGAALDEILLDGRSVRGHEGPLLAARPH